jgi:hypothetical protein
MEFILYMMLALVALAGLGVLFGDNNNSDPWG